MLKFMYDRKIQKTLVMRKTETYKTTKSGARYPVFETLGFIEKLVEAKPITSKAKETKQDAAMHLLDEQIQAVLSTAYWFRPGKGKESLITDSEKDEIDARINLEKHEQTEILRAYMQQHGKDLINKIDEFYSKMGE